MFHLFVVLVVASGFLALRWVITLPDRVDAQRTLLVSPSRLTPDSDASLRVVVQNTEDGKPIDDARVAVSLAPSDDPLRARPLFRGRTDEAGTLPVAFHVPSNAPDDAILIVETRSPVGRDRVERPVTIERQYRLLLTTDKPVYQPGQTIHMRAIALSTLDRSPATGASVDFLVEDPRGNKVYRQSVTASHFGVVAADFTLADLVNQGDYKLSVSIDGVTSERTVEVRPYALPKFGLKVSTDRSFYLPGQRVEGTVQADYFFGKPVAQAQVHVVGSVWDVERTVVVDLRGQTDERGSYTFGFDLPRYFAASGFESGQAQFALEISVVDQTNHPEQVSRVLPIAAQPLLIEAVPESGILKLGVENVVYLLTSYPDGRPARAKVRIAGPVGLPAELETNAYGLAEFTFAPTAGTSPVLDVQAQDESGLFAHRRLELGTQAGSDAVLLRTDRAAYLVGETMHLVALTPAPASAMMPSGSIYLDVVKSGQTLSTRSAPVEHGDGKAAARFTVEVTSEMIGELEIHAYKVGPDGGLVRDTRLVAVDAPRDLKVDVSTDRASYLPGQTALVDLDVQDEQGAAVPAALGVAVVDESVFALQRQAPGFAKLYFLLRQELMEPFVQIDGFALPASQPAENEDDTVRQAQDTAAKASWASVPAATMPQPLNSRQEKVEAAYAAQQEGFALLGRASSLALVALPVALCAGVAIALARSGTAKRSLKRWTGASALLLVIDIVAARALLGAPYTFETEVVFIPLAGTLVLTLLALTVTAWVRRDAGAKTLLLLVLAWAGALFLLLRAVDQGATPPDNLILAALLATPLMPGAFLLFGQSRWVERRRLVGALSTGLGSLTALPLLLMLLPLLSGGLLFGPRMGAMGPQARFRTLGDDEALWNAQPAGVRVEEVALEGEEMEKGAATTVDTQQTHAQAPRLRQWFPETLYWAPDVETDAQGHTALEIPMADSITTWRLTALASSQDGRLGFVTHGLRVFQDFFVDVDLPISLTQGDEISIPVGVFNYLPQAQKVRLEVEPEDWFELLGSGEQTLTIGSNDIEVVYFPIRVRSFGRSGFQVTAWGEQMSDAVRREVDVVPNGKEIRLTESDWLRGDCQVAVDIPQRAVPGASRVEVKIYPGVLAQVVEGLEKILRLPHG
jgi:uncharacterized protein YfaS (alpha-2-macroglobulin family)